MPATYEIRDKNGFLVQSVPDVVAHVHLTSVSTTSASNILTVASTTNCYPGMAVFAPNIPRGAFIHAVKSATELELWASSWNASTGVWTTSAANAQATANGSSMLAQAQGFNPVPVTQWYAEGTWRNLHQTSSSGAALSSYGITASDGFARLIGVGAGAGIALVPTALSVTAGVITPTAAAVRTSDTLDATPLKRHEGSPLGAWVLVSTGGYQTVHLISRGETCAYAGASA